MLILIKGLTEEEKYKVLRPIIGNYEEDKYHMPIINKADIKSVNWNKLNIISFKSVSKNKTLSNSIVLMFNYDKDLMRLWNNPLKYVPKYQTAAFVATPDFSVYPNMHPNELQLNVFKGRWIGKTWQNYGCKVIPTIPWATPDTYDLCFTGIEKGSAVIISTIGCQNNAEMFLNGFNEMKKRINPELIIVYGDMIQGMTGRFVNYKYEDAFSRKHSYQQLKLFDNEPIFTIKEEA